MNQGKRKKAIYWGSVIAFVASILPILYMSFFDYATGDDLGKGWRAHQVIVSHGTIMDFFRAVNAEAMTEYVGWEGTWFSNIILAAPPNVWHERLYAVTPWLAIFFMAFGTWLLLRELLGGYLGFDQTMAVPVTAVLMIFSIQYIPFIRGGLFWYTGVAHYQFPYGVALITLALLLAWYRKKKTRDLILIYVCMFYMGGSHYQAIVLCYELFFLALIIGFVMRKKNILKNKDLGLLTGAFIVGLVGFIVSAIAPGNAVRAASEGDTMSLSIGRLIGILVGCFTGLCKDILTYFIAHRLMILMIPVLALIVWIYISGDEEHFSSKVPVSGKILTLVSIFCICIAASVYAPGIYTSGEVSGGVANTNYYVFLLMLAIWIIYFVICIRTWCGEKVDQIVQKGYIPFWIVLALFMLVTCRHWIGQTADYVCYEYAASGQLRDFRKQMQDRLVILEDETIKDAVVDKMNSEQGPYMHMPLTEDENNYTNYVTALYYNKESVVAK